jgi:hypothetical protein
MAPIGMAPSISMRRTAALIRGRPGAVVELSVGHHAGRRHLPVVTLKRVE